jgi:hypothetical protein
MSRAVTMETLNSLGRVLATEFEEQLDLVCFPHKGRVGYLAKLGRVKRPELASDFILAHPAVRHACVCPQLGDEHGRAAEIMFNLRGLALGDNVSGPAAACPLLGDSIERAMPGLGLGNASRRGPGNRVSLDKQFPRPPAEDGPLQLDHLQRQVARHDPSMFFQAAQVVLNTTESRMGPGTAIGDHGKLLVRSQTDGACERAKEDLFHVSYFELPLGRGGPLPLVADRVLRLIVFWQAPIMCPSRNAPHLRMIQGPASTARTAAGKFDASFVWVCYHWSPGVFVPARRVPWLAGAWTNWN